MYEKRRGNYSAATLDDLMKPYKKHLLQSAFDLQSRLTQQVWKCVGVWCGPGGLTARRAGWAGIRQGRGPRRQHGHASVDTHHALVRTRPLHFQSPLTNQPAKQQARPPVCSPQINNNFLYNFVDEKGSKKGRERERKYAIDSTAYFFAEFLAWLEIIRSQVVFVTG
eukprot:354901-Chlamydomonas_euryale.AAC.1